MAELDGVVESASADASKTYPQQASGLRKNGFVMIKERPCRIIEMSTSKTGKHGHAKVHIVALDIFTSRKYEDICPSTHNMNVPHVSRKDYQLLDIDDGYISMMDEEDGSERSDLKVPDGDVGKTVQEKFDKGESFLVTVLKSCDEEQVIGTKVLSEK